MTMMTSTEGRPYDQIIRQSMVVVALIAATIDSIVLQL